MPMLSLKVTKNQMRVGIPIGEDICPIFTASCSEGTKKISVDTLALKSTLLKNNFFPFIADPLLKALASATFPARPLTDLTTYDLDPDFFEAQFSDILRAIWALSETVG